MLNKPAGYLTTMKDPQGRPTIVDMVPTRQIPRLFLLDVLIWILHLGLCSYYRWPDGSRAPASLSMYGSTYVAHGAGTLTEEQPNCLREGIELEDGPAAPAEVEIVSNDAKMKALRPTGLENWWRAKLPGRAS